MTSLRALLVQRRSSTPSSYDAAWRQAKGLAGRILSEHLDVFHVGGQNRYPARMSQGRRAQHGVDVSALT